ncbi:MAG: rod shape-determining protein MreC [Bacteroidetes bacterium]|nr:rod shape-determining protein MreC [Bacteroidota bacterium]
MFLLFLVLQGIALLLMAKSSVYQQAGMSHFFNAGRSKVWEYQDNILNYFKLNSINRELAEENTRLRTLLFAKSESAYPNTGTDSLFAFIGAEVVFNSTSRLQNYIVINRGSKHGVEPDMGVIGSHGVVGIVQSVDKNYALVRSLLNTRFQINVRVTPGQYTGTLSWNGKSIRTATISDMPQHSSVSLGDTVVTSGFSEIFPAHIPIGVIKATSIKKGTYMDANVELFQNFNTLEYVNIIRSLHIGEIKALLQDYE